MEEIYFYGYAEDEPSCAVMRRLFDYANMSNSDGKRLVFRPGFPENKRGYGNLKNLATNLVQMTGNAGLFVFVMTDLDQEACVPMLIQRWFPGVCRLPDSLIFRVAVREVESWILADRVELANFLGIPKANFSREPDTLGDPKSHLLDVIRTKGRKRFHRDMLPTGNAHIGPEYNRVLCDFVNNHWNIDEAQQYSPSLQRTVDALRRIA
ncbi:MAG TPA: hypothetical protein ENJ35_05555 [Gammaproteobacteria bacterium]|nr:hypothetical protein [Gammaproteobacteria bacterium]